MLKSVIRFLQKELSAAGHDVGPIDGVRRPQTEAAIEKALAQRDDAPRGSGKWSIKRQAIALIQLWCRDASIEVGEIDGGWGPGTEYAYKALVEQRQTGGVHRNWRDEEPLADNPHRWPKQTPQSELEDFFGPHGVQGGHRPPLERVDCPWTLTLDWEPYQTTSKILVHELCADSLREVLANVYDHYGSDEIKRLGLHLYGGSYNPRKMRRSARWSMHAWGIALDWYPSRNRLNWGMDRAVLARAEYLEWWKFWEKEGWVSLGRSRNFDWMHVQAARL